jgi:hypothetical protein
MITIFPLSQSQQGPFVRQMEPPLESIGWGEAALPRGHTQDTEIAVSGIAPLDWDMSQTRKRRYIERVA